MPAGNQFSLFATPGDGNWVSRRGDRESESLRRRRGEVSAEWAFFGPGCERSLDSVREAEIAGRGGENGRQRAKKRATPGVDALGVACQLVCQTIRSRWSGSPRGTLFVTILGTFSAAGRERGQFGAGHRRRGARAKICGRWPYGADRCRANCPLLYTAPYTAPETVPLSITLGKGAADRRLFSYTGKHEA
jgi:hypothetical protein